MMTRTLVLTGVMAMFGLTGCAVAQPVMEYVHAPDDSFAWEVTGQSEMAGGTLTELNVTSQTWRDMEWTHRVNVFVPPNCEDTSVALMMITGGSPGGQELLLLSSAAQMLGAPVVILGDIPNQPLFDGLNEDALISYTFTKYLESGEIDWPLLFPMTKAAVRTMDAVEAFSAEAWEQPVERWITTGASKRGWTTWFTGAVVRDRLEGIAPMVYDNLDLPAQMKHQVDAWGDYSVMIRDYTERGLPDMLATAEGRALGAIVDPYTLRHRITMPKLTITGTNDPYWPLDAANLYWDGLPQPNYILYVPNGGHGLDDFERVINAQVGFFKASTGQVPLPEPTWEFEDIGYLKLTVDPGDELPVIRVSEIKAHSPTRDFRDAQWTESDAIEHRGRYIARALHPEEGYTALLAEIVYEVDGREFPLSTNVRIIGPGE